MRENKPYRMRRFTLFSVALFLFVCIGGSAIFMFSIQNIVSENKGKELSQILALERIKLETSVNAEIAIALKLADSPLIRQYFAHPQDTALKKMAFDELASYRSAFENESIFWVNDIERIFYSDDNEPYSLNPENPDNYWYNMTLYETEAYNFNINYNPDLDVTNLWINAPVFDDKHKPLGIVGTGINLSTFIDTLYQNYTGGAELYFFNSAGEITGARDIGLVAGKKDIEDVLGGVGFDIHAAAKDIKPGETLVYGVGSDKIAIGTIPVLNWYTITAARIGIKDYDQTMIALFLVMLIVIAMILVIFNVFIAGFLKSLRKTMDSLDEASKAEIDLKNETERIMKKKLEHSIKFSKTLAEMTKHPTISAGFLKDAADVIAKEGCAALGASRIGIWRLSPDSNVLESITYYDASEDKFTIQEDFSLSGLDEYYTLLVSQRMIVMNDTDECRLITGSFYGYNCLCAALDAPVRIDGKLFGVVCVEQYSGEEFSTGRKWTIEEQNFVSSLADLMALAISGFERRKAQMAAEAATAAKSDFLAKTSHEIRTPMNAIIGMAELALREDMPEKPREHILTIKQAGANLISIINDILDFSKIESGKLEIIPDEYLFSSLLNDVISIIRMRVVDKQVRFVVNIDSNIPNAFFGDEARIRQVLLNLLNNAVKFTQKGYVSFTVTGQMSGNTETLTMEISDSGKGIKPEDIDKLFGDFVQIDLARNKGVEGTGLGLAIARNLIRAMGGDITVVSEYGKGSTFTVTLPQTIRDSVKIASVINPDEKSVLVYERREMYANSIICTVDNLSVECALVSTDAEFREALEHETYPFVFIASGLYENVREICETAKTSKIVLLAGFGEAVANKNVSVLAMPVYSVSVANILNDVYDGFTYSESWEAAVRFTAPDANVLIVDDIDTNLNVAKGLLLPYKMRLDLRKSGMEAIDAIAGCRYDLILMDHMMPEIDGLEATRRIRAETSDPYYQNVPIIALTANAVSGSKEMFLTNGFNDFLSKPIDTVKLNTILERWIPKMKRKRIAPPDGAGVKARGSGAHITIRGVDSKKGIAIVGGNIENYKKILAVFKNDGIQKLDEIKKCLETDNLPLYTIYVHALKSAAANIGATELSEMAKALETAGKQNDTAFIQTKNTELISALESLLRGIDDFLEADKGESDEDSITDMSPLTTALTELAEAINNVNPRAIKEAVKNIRPFARTPNVGTIVKNILQNTLVGEYDEAMFMIKVMLKGEQP